MVLDIAVDVKAVSTSPDATRPDVAQHCSVKQS